MRITTVLFLLACASKDPADSGPGDEADADTDADSDTDADTDADADADADADLWEGCPRADSAVGDAVWAGTLEVTGGALYCAWAEETWTLEAAMAHKMQVRIVPGSYPAPTTSLTAPMTLPMCARGGDGAVVASAGEGEVITQTAGSFWQLSLEEPGEVGTFAAYALHDLSEGSALPIDGLGPTEVGTTAFAATFTAADGTAYAVSPCESAATWVRNSHLVTFEGGWVRLELHIGYSFASTEPHAFVSAEGQLDGVDFSQTDYHQLAYRPDHHHFGRHFALRLPSPIGEACALRIEDLDPYDPSLGKVSLADCDLAVRSARSFLSDELTRTAP